MPAAYSYLDSCRAEAPTPGAYPVGLPGGPTRWGKQGRINLVGTLCFEGEDECLEFRLLEGSCRSREVVAYLDLLAEEAQRGKPNGRASRLWWCWTERPSIELGWCATGGRDGRRRGSGSTTCQRSACPHLNPIEGVWRRLKRFLMPRRFYDSLAELREAVLSALSLLGAVELQC
jgi:putative transposase